MSVFVLNLKENCTEEFTELRACRTKAVVLIEIV